jgi:hypothetical protein
MVGRESASVDIGHELLEEVTLVALLASQSLVAPQRYESPERVRRWPSTAHICKHRA